MIPPQRRRWLGPALALAGAVTYLALLGSAAGGFADHDVFVMARVARDVLDGKALYEQAWDNKAPLAILFYAVPGAIAPRSYVAVQLWLGVWLLGQAAIVWLGLGRESGAARWIAAGLVLLLPLQRAEWCWASSEHAANLFVLVTLVVAWRIATRGAALTWELLAAGVATALAFNVRQNQCLYGAMPALALLVASRGRWRGAVRPIAVLAAGALAAALLVLALTWAASHGTLEGYVHTVFLAPAAYGRAWSDVAWLIAPFRHDLTVFLIFAIALVALTGPRRWFAAALVPITVAVMLLPMRGYPHYWVQAFPAVALLGALAGEALGLARSARAALQGAIVATLLAASGVWTIVDLASSGEREQLDVVAARIAATAGPGDTLFAAGHLSAYLYFASAAPTAQRIFWQDWMYGSLKDVLPVPLDQVIRRYVDSPPRVLAIDEPTLQRVVHQPAADEEADVPLLRTLLSSGRYAEVARAGDWRILRR